MNVRDLYPSKYATGLDLDGKPVTLTISSIKRERMTPPGAGTVEKYVIYFAEAKRGVVLSRILAGQIAAAIGLDETDQWPGNKVTLYPENISVAGQVRTVIRARAAKEEAHSRRDP